MKRILTFGDFCDAFFRMDRKDAFSYEGKRCLFDWLEEIDPDYELDVVGLCCEYQESHAETIIQDYCLEPNTDDEEERTEFVRNYLNENTCIVGKLSECVFVFQQF